MIIQRLQTEAEIARCFEVVRELRPKLESADHFLTLMRRVLAEGAQGAQIAALEAEGAVTTVAVFRVQTMLVSGLTMYVDDLITAERSRSQGHGKAMLTWLVNHARERGCETFSLDSGTFRKDAHAFYFREGMRISSFHFERKL